MKHIFAVTVTAIALTATSAGTVFAGGSTTANAPVTLPSWISQYEASSGRQGVISALQQPDGSYLLTFDDGRVVSLSSLTVLFLLLQY